MARKITITVEFDDDEITKRQLSRAVQSAARSVTQDLPEGPIEQKFSIDGSINKKVSFTVKFE